MSGVRKPKNKIIAKNPNPLITPATFFNPTAAITAAAVTTSVVAVESTTEPVTQQPTIILHLKCAMADVMPDKKVFTPPQSIPQLDTSPSIVQPHIPITNDWLQIQTASYNISNKLKTLETQLHCNYCENKQGACFWCTCDFDTTPVHIPKHIMNDAYYVYGRFCSPECAVGYLMNDNLDTSVKFSRYTLLNQMYGKLFGYTKNINPAPDPRYTLDKFCGNLTITEYRSLSKINKQLFIVDKPLVKLMPELHQDMSDVLNFNKLLSGNNMTTMLQPPPPPIQMRKKSLMSLFTKTTNDGTTLL